LSEGIEDPPPGRVPVDGSPPDRTPVD
jgi:hypothetical protein